MIALRPAKPTDAGAVGGILSEFVDTTDWMPQIHTRAEDIAHAGALIERGWVTVAEVDGAVVGFAACNDAELNALYVAKCKRGSGIGSELLAALQQTRSRLELWTFEVNTRAQSFYERHGFTEVTRTDGKTNDEKLPDIRFEWQKGGS